MIAYIGLGSNLGDSIQYLNNALFALAKNKTIILQDVSSFYRSQAQMLKNSFPQPNYLNAVACLTTDLSAQNLLALLQKIELDNGRIRHTARWTARTLDLDLLLYGNEVIQETNLIVPHPWMCRRTFVLYPLRELTQKLGIHLRLPDGTTLNTHIKNIPDEEKNYCHYFA